MPDIGRKFTPIPLTTPGQEFTVEHAIILSYYRCVHGIPPAINQSNGQRLIPTAAQLNNAIAWINKLLLLSQHEEEHWQNMQQRKPDHDDTTEDANA